MRITLHPTTLPITPQLRIIGGPRFNNTYMEDASRDPQSQTYWDEAKWEWQLRFVKGSREFGVAKGFWLARKGGAFAWWFFDPLDQFATDGGGRGLIKTAPDGKRYVFKEYPDAFAPYLRLIRCPVAGSVKTLAGANVSTDPHTGEVLSAHPDGTLITFQFRCPVIFSGDFQEVEHAPANAPGEWQAKIMEVGKFKVATK